jgi:hypothetical protein
VLRRLLDDDKEPSIKARRLIESNESGLITEVTLAAACTLLRHREQQERSRGDFHYERIPIYEFAAVDYPLTTHQMAKRCACSSHATITPTPFVNEYHWVDLNGQPLNWMQRFSKRRFIRLMGFVVACFCAYRATPWRV